MPSRPILTAEDCLAIAEVQEAIRRRIFTVSNGRIRYFLANERTYSWGDPEEWVRAFTVAWLVIEKGYPVNRMKVEVTVPRRTPSDLADIVVYEDDGCRSPYLVVENKASGQTIPRRVQGIEQLFGNANSLRAPLGLYDEGAYSQVYAIGAFPAEERDANRLGERDALPAQYGAIPDYTYVAGSTRDIVPMPARLLEAKVRRAHSLIWAGGKRDPLNAFDEWSKLLFAKVIDERHTRNGQPRRFQVGLEETSAAVATRIHGLFAQACQADPLIFSGGARIELPDAKIVDVVRVLQTIAFTRTDIDSIGQAFEQFFGSVFRGGLGQYFTMRPLARFVVAALRINADDYVFDPTCGSGGFLLEALLQVWHQIDRDFRGQQQVDRIKYDFAHNQVYGVEIHDILSRICKINLLLHHDGHTNVEAGRSVLDSSFSSIRLNPPRSKFSKIVGNPPFGSEVQEGDLEQLGENHLANFEVARGLRKVESEQVILERTVELLEPGGECGLVLPDGLFNNQGELSNAVRTRSYLAKNGKILGIISLPDYAFRKSGAQNKTSVLIFRKFDDHERRVFQSRLSERCEQTGGRESSLISQTIIELNMDYQVFLAEANWVGYTSVGAPSDRNDLYRADASGHLMEDQEGSILAEWMTFLSSPESYTGKRSPDCMSLPFSEIWSAHQSHRLDPKYHLFTREALEQVPPGWISVRLGDVLVRREDNPDFTIDPDGLFDVMTIAQTGDIRHRVAGKGRTPSEWRGSYFEESPGSWFAARGGDVVYSSIDLWKGCIAVVPPEFDGALVTKEFPIYEVIDQRLTPEFLQSLLRSRYYQRAFRAITTGHSNRRRTQAGDFENLELIFPPDPDLQREIINSIEGARLSQAAAARRMRSAVSDFDALIDGRDSDLPEIELDEAEE
jgi:type I restriction enzyme M protein